jgi:hypothetical protein
MAMYSGTREFLMHRSHNTAYLSDEQLHSMKLCIYHGITVQVEGLDGECISQMHQCTGSQSWCGGTKQNDWVWVKQHSERCYGTLNGSVPWQLQRLFKMNLLNKDGTFIEYWLPLALTTIPENSGNLDPILKIVQVRKAPASVTLHVFSVENIVSCMHIISGIASSIKIGDVRNERWIVNSHIDLVTWNDVYNS